MMQNILLEALAAAVVGGMGSLSGAAAGALITGVVTSVIGLYVPVAFLPLIPSAIILIAMLIRPQGFGAQAAARTV
jgi:branched-subunit amino acid ABC-type transport system permease component